MEHYTKQRNNKYGSNSNSSVGTRTYIIMNIIIIIINNVDKRTRTTNNKKQT